MSMTQPVATVIAALISAFIGGVSAAVVTFLLNRKKMQAETEKLIVDTEKTRLEAEKMRGEMKTLVETVNYSLPAAKEQVVFDSRQGIDGFDVKGFEGNFWIGQGKDARPASPKGEGSLRIEEGGVLNIQRTNTEGRFEVLLQQYLYDGKKHALIPKNELIGGRRKLRIGCEAKTIGADHLLRFIVRDPVTYQRLADDVKRIDGNDWTPIEVFLQVDPTIDVQVRIDDEAVSAVPSSVQLRNLVVAERIS